MSTAVCHRQVPPSVPPLATAKGEAGVGDLELSLLTSPHFPSLGPKQLVSCHLIAKTLGRSLSLLFLSERTLRNHFSQDPVQRKTAPPQQMVTFVLHTPTNSFSNSDSLIELDTGKLRPKSEGHLQLLGPGITHSVA